MNEQDIVEDSNADVAEEQVNEDILDLFEVTDNVEDFAMAVCW